MKLLKKHSLSSIALLLLFVSCKHTEKDTAPKDVRERLIGVWVYQNDTRKLSMEFKADGSVLMVWEDETDNGNRKIKTTGEEERIWFEIDEKKDPMALVIKAYAINANTPSKTTKGIFRFLTDTKIQYYATVDGKLPENFNNVQSVVLEKVK